MNDLYTDQNVICSMLYQRGEQTSTNGIKTVSGKQIQNVVEKYNLRENRIACATGEISKCSTDRWSVEETQSGRFLLSQRGVV